MAREPERKKKRGRPELPPEEKRGEQLHFFVRTDEREKFDAAADRSGLSLSAWIRRALLRAAGRQR